MMPDSRSAPSPRASDAPGPARMLVRRLLTWWNGQTLGTQLDTLFRGRRVGEDSDGNVYYRNADGTRRWVIYDGEMEASKVPPDWHGWLHHTVAHPPTERKRRDWERPHRPNRTGTEEAYAPPGSLRRGAAETRPDYVAWRPDAPRDSERN